MQRLEPTLGSLLEAAAASGEIRADITPRYLLYAVANLSLPLDTAHGPKELFKDALFHVSGDAGPLIAHGQRHAARRAKRPPRRVRKCFVTSRYGGPALR